MDKEIEGMNGLYKIQPIKMQEIVLGEKVFIIKDNSKITVKGICTDCNGCQRLEDSNFRGTDKCTWKE